MNLYKFKTIFILSLFVIMFSLASCGYEKIDRPDISVEEEEEEEEEEDKDKDEVIDEEMLMEVAEITEAQLKAASIFRAVSRADEGYQNSLYVYSSKSYEPYQDNPAKLAARIRLLGFNNIYLGLNKIMDESEEVQNWTRSLNKYLHTYGVKSHNIFTHSSTLYDDPSAIAAFLEEHIMTFNSRSEPEERFDGISADLEPHIIKEAISTNCPWYWDNNNYGIGNDNDMLMKRTVEMMDAVYEAAGDEYEISQTTVVGVQNYYDAGLLSWGTTAQFLERSCDWIIIMAYGASATNTLNKMTPILEANKTINPKSISVAISVNEVVSNEGATLYPLGWDGMIGAINEICTEAEKYDSYRGFDVFTFMGLESLWLE